MDPFKYREIVGTFTARLPDGGDSDQLPDRVPLNGYGTLRPNIRGTSIVFTEVGEFAVPRTRQVAIVDGELMVEVVDGESVILQPLFLEVTVDERANQEWSWTLTFDSLTIGDFGEEISHPALSFPVEDGDGPLELSTVATTVTRTANFVTRGAPGAGITDIIAANGQLEFEYSDGRVATVDMPDAVPGPPGKIPDLTVENIVDTSPVGQQLMKATSQGAAREALDLAEGATSTSGSLPELKAGTSSSPRVWAPKSLADYTTDRVTATESAIREDTSLHPNPAGQGLNYMDFFTAWDSRQYVSDAWTQGFSVNEDAQEIYVSAYSTTTYAQWVECRDYGGSLMWRTEDIPVPGSPAWSEGCPYYYDGENLCFILRVDPGGFVRTYNTVTKVLSEALPVAGNTKLFGDGEHFYCAEGDPGLAILTAVHAYSLESFKGGAPVLVRSIQLDRFGPQEQDNKPQGLAVRDGFIYTSAGKRDASVDGTGRLDLRVYNPMGRIVSSVVLDKVDYYRVLEEQKRPQDHIPNHVSFENEGVYPLRDGRILTMNHIHRQVFITAHGTGGRGRVKTAASAASVSHGWQAILLSDGVTPSTPDVRPSFYRDGAKVYIRGAFKGAPQDVGSSFSLGRIPRGYRPAINESFLMPSNGSAYWRGYVETNGNVRIVAYGGGTLGPSSWLPLSFSYIADGLVT